VLRVIYILVGQRVKMLQCLDATEIMAAWLCIQAVHNTIH